MTPIAALYVDDEPDLLELTRLYLGQDKKITLDTSLSAEEAESLLASRRYDVIVSDYQMPGMNGIAFLQFVREHYGRIPFILFTGRGREEVVIQALENGADFYLQKGGDPRSQFAELRNKIEKAVAAYRADSLQRDAEQRLLDILDFLPDAAIAIDRKGKVIFWNKAIEEMTGMPAEQMLGKGNYEYTIPFYGERRPVLIDLVFSTPEEIQKHYSGIVRTGSTLAAETTLPHPHGNPRVLWGKAGPLYDRNGAVVGAIEVVRDITDRKQTEAALRESEEKFREMADLMPQIIYEVDRDGVLTYANAIAFRWFGYTKEEFARGLHVSGMFVPEDRGRAAGALAAIMAGSPPPPEGQEYLALRKDGSTFPVMIYTVPVVRAGEVTGLRGIVVDISGRKQAELATRERERVLSTLISNLPGFVYRCRNDRNWTMTYISAGCRDLTGYDPDDFLENRHIAFSEIIHPDYREKVWERWQQALSLHEVYEDEYLIVTRSGGTRWVWERGLGVYSDDGTLLFLEGFITDVTGRKNAEEALARKSRELEKKSTYYELLLRTSVDPIYVLDQDGRLREWNNAFLSHVGYSAEEAACLKVSDWNAEWSENQLRERILTMIRQGGRLETRHRRKDGTIRDVEITGNSVLIDGEMFLYTSARDITDSKQAEAQIRESENRYRNIVESFEDLYYETDTEGIIRYLSPSCYRLSGWQAKELVGMPVETVYTDTDSRNTLMNLIQKTGYVRDYELVLKKRDGTHTPVSLSAHIIRDPGGPPTGIAGSLRDISARKSAEEEIRKSREQLALAIEGSGAGLWDWNIRDGTVMFNGRWADIAGYTLAELEPVSYATWERLCHPEDLRRSEALLRDHFAGNVPYELEVRIRHKDGRWVWVIDRGKVVEWDGEGKPARMIGVHLDITELKQMAEALRQANSKLNLLASITRHDIRNQLTALRGFLAISKSRLDEPARMGEFIAKEEQIADTLERQITFTRYYQDMGVKDPVWHAVDVSVRQEAASFALHGVEILAGCPGLEVYADPLFEKVFYNLIDNALRYGGDRLNLIRVSCRETEAGLVLVFEDNGAGISGEDRKHLFERGFGKNTGLGLFLVREILGITGITIQETGEVGKGARFEMLVPKGKYRLIGS